MKYDSQFDWRGSIRTLFVALLCALGIGIAQAAWQGPPNIPNDCPTGNVGCDSPLNVGSTDQTKVGGITAGSLTTAGEISASSLSVASTSANINPNVSVEIGSGASGTKGLLMPRMSTSQRDSLTNLPDGFTIYNTTNKRLEYYGGGFGGNGWVASATTSSATVAPGYNDGPAFSANLAANTTYSSGSSYQKLTGFTLSSTVSSGFDSNNNFNTTTGTFAPTVVGKYLLTANIWTSSYWAYTAICKNGANPSSPANYKNPNCKYGFTQQTAGGEGNTITAVFDITAADIGTGTNTFNMWAYINSAAGQNTIYGDSQPGSYTYFSGTRIGNPVNQTTITNPAVTINVPSGAVMFFNKTSCPDATWSAMDGTVAGVPNMKGMYPVGAYQTTDVGNSVGNRLTRAEDRNVAGPHTHTVNPLTVNPLYENPLTYYDSTLNAAAATALEGGQSGNYGYVVVYPGYGSSITDNARSTTATYTNAGTTGSGTTGSGTTASAGSAGTNSPYVMLLACQKN